MLSNFKSIVMSIISARKAEIASAEEWEITSMEKKLNAGASISDAISFLKGKKFTSNFTNDDWRKIEKELGHNLNK
jgi:hypothetical protein